MDVPPKTIHQAAKEGDPELCETLLKKQGANIINEKDERGGDTPLNLAAWAGHIEAVRFLLERPETDVNIANTLKQTPLHSAVRVNGREEIIKMLLRQKRTDFNARES